MTVYVTPGCSQAAPDALGLESETTRATGSYVMTGSGMFPASSSRENDWRVTDAGWRSRSNAIWMYPSAGSVAPRRPLAAVEPDDVEGGPIPSEALFCGFPRHIRLTPTRKEKVRPTASRRAWEAAKRTRNGVPDQLSE